ncbi:MAG: DNA endonuclease SmrA [Pseudomonadales bacterium]|nr:DNA endonuclease SmrA [Pseudomonadales bacterium]
MPSVKTPGWVFRDNILFRFRIHGHSLVNSFQVKFSSLRINNLDSIQMTDDEFEQFKKETSDIVPIKQTHVQRIVTSKKPTDAQIARQLSASTDPKIDNNTLSSDYVDMIDPHDIIHFKKEGVQEGVYRKLRLGKYPTEAVLDLHRRKLEQARHDTFEFIRDSRSMELRTVMILHGKGARSNPPALLKSYVNKWLVELDDVLAFHSAQQHHGGTGAVYILLRKSERAKQRNRDQHSR